MFEHDDEGKDQNHMPIEDDAAAEYGHDDGDDECHQPEIAFAKDP